MKDKYIDGREVVKKKEIIELIYDRGSLLKDNFPKTYSIDFFLKNKIDFISTDDERNLTTNSHLFFKDSVSMVEKAIIDKIEIHNEGDIEFKIIKNDFLDSETFEDNFYNCDEASVLLAKSSPILFGTDDDGLKNARRYVRRYCEKFNYIKTESNNIYFLKREIDSKVEDLSKTTKKEDAKLILGNQSLHGRKVVKIKEITKLILERNSFLENHFPKTDLIDFFSQNEIDFLSVKDERNPYKNHANAFFVDSIPVVEQKMIDLIQIHNTEENEFNITRDSLNAETIVNEFYSSEDAGVLIGNSLPTLFKLGTDNKFFKRNAGKMMLRNRERFNYIQVGDMVNNNVYFHKKEIDQLAKNLSNLMSSRDALEIVNERLNIDVKYRTFSGVVEREGFVSKIKVPLNSDWFWINKSDIDNIVLFFDNRNKLSNAQTIYGRLKVILSSMEKVKNDKIPKTLEYFDSYCLEKSNKSNARNIANRATLYKNVYLAITSRLAKEIYELDVQEIEDITLYAKQYTDTTAKELRKFYNYVVEKKNMEEKKLKLSRPKYEKIEAYPLEMYFKILANIMEKLCDKTFINSLIGDRSLSSLVLYIYTHYISVWRRSDIIEDLPKPNLKLIGFNTGQEFIDWLKAGNIFTEKMGKSICEDVQEKIYIYRETANKNGGDLLLYVSEYMYSTYGLLLAICEANRHLKQNGHANTSTLIARGSVYTKRQGELLPYIFDNVDEVFGDNTSFSNKKANKAFETYVAKKSEEWNIGVGFILASIFRGHRINSSLIAEVTKVYITKDVNEASVRAFNMGVMSGVKYKLLEAIGVDTSGERKEIDRKVSEIKLNPLQTEIVMKNLADKSKTINEFLDKVLTGENAELTVKEVLYGKKSYGKHVYTKCLYRAFINAQQGQNEYISKQTKHCINSNCEGCIGCPFLLAERFFLYEVERRLSKAVDALNNTKNKIDKKIHFNRIVNLYLPLLKEACEELGINQVKSIVDIDKTMQVVNQHQYLLVNN